MTETTTRTNKQGDPCPDWCVTDHAKGYNFHGADQARYIIRSKAAGWYPETVQVRAINYGSDHQAPEVALHATSHNNPERGGSSLWQTPEDAVKLADVIETLATATAAQHRQIANAIRQAAVQAKNA